MFLLAKTFGVTVEDLMEETPREAHEAKPEDVAFFREYAGMTDEEKERYRQALKLMFPGRGEGDAKP